MDLTQVARPSQLAGVAELPSAALLGAGLEHAAVLAARPYRRRLPGRSIESPAFRRTCSCPPRVRDCRARRASGRARCPRRRRCPAGPAVRGSRDRRRTPCTSPCCALAYLAFTWPWVQRRRSSRGSAMATTWASGSGYRASIELLPRLPTPSTPIVIRSPAGAAPSLPMPPGTSHGDAAAAAVPAKICRRVSRPAVRSPCERGIFMVGAPSHLPLRRVNANSTSSRPSMIVALRVPIR